MTFEHSRSQTQFRESKEILAENDALKAAPFLLVISFCTVRAVRRTGCVSWMTGWVTWGRGFTFFVLGRIPQPPRGPASAAIALGADAHLPGAGACTLTSTALGLLLCDD